MHSECVFATYLDNNNDDDDNTLNRMPGHNSNLILSVDLNLI